ncbi:WD40 domain containing protein [Pyrrhoderma noxium]|uniref:WD40 domain containing protein n=1 Tax=Pyrrhoderma noxium TaxID=2282107 RepID=A0A286UFC3_9AGAM|nr:WD40 domain containing protein [Pyrrhoderma noxium]
MTLLENRQKIDDFRSIFNQLKEQFDRGIITNTALVIARMSEKIDTIYLQNLLKPKEFDAPHSVKCDLKTYKDVLSSLTTLLLSTSKKIIWLHGPPGCGKSTISLTLAENFNSTLRLGAYLYFSDESSSPSSVIATIAFKLACFDSTLGRIISDRVSRYHGGLTVKTQFKEYLLDPLTEGARAVNGPVIIILDGLDKYKNNVSLLELISSGLFSELPHNFRFLITSRWGKEIASSFLAFPSSVHQVFLNISNDYASPVINLFDHMDSICKQTKRYHDENKHKHSFDCFSSRIYTQIRPVPQLCLDNNYGLTLPELSFMNMKLKSIVMNHTSLKGQNEDIPNLDILSSENISPMLRHACLSWSSTLSNAVLLGPMLEMNTTILSQFIHEKLLTWIEVMSLMGRFNAIGPILRQVIPCLEGCDKKLAIFLQDALDLLTDYGECISSCAYEVYRSMLHLEGGRSQVANHYQNSRVSNIWIEKFGYQPIEGHNGTVLSVAFSPDGSRIASGSGDETVRIWDSKSGNFIAGPFREHSNWILSVAFSPDGTRIASGSADKTVLIWDSETGKLVAGPFEGHSSGVLSVAFSPDGSRIASGSRDKTVRIWDVHSDPASHRERPNSSSTNSTQTSSSQPSPPVGSSELDWTLGDDGWIKGNDGEILIWVPKELRKYICPPEKSCFKMFEKTGYSLKPHFYKE